LTTAAAQDEATAVELAAVKLLGGREHSRAELERKLAARHHDAGLIDAVLDALERRRLLSDRRFAESYAAQRSRRGYGPLRIRAELAARGVDAQTVGLALEEAGCDWAALLEETAARKFGQAPAEDMRALARRGRFLEQRGFPSGMIGRYLDQVRHF
jgi:regulatory protein